MNNNVRVSIREHIIDLNHRSEDTKNIITNKIINTINSVEGLDEFVSYVSFYYMNGKEEANLVGSDTTLYILNNSTKAEGNEVRFGTMDNPLPSSDKFSVYSNIMYDGKVVAQHYFSNVRGEMCNTLNILVDVIGEEYGIIILEHVLKEIVKKERKKGIWSTEENNDVRNDIIRLVASKEENRRQEKRRELESVEEDIKHYKEILIKGIRRASDIRDSLGIFNATSKRVINRIVKDFDLIANHERIDWLKVERDEIIFKTNHLNFFDEYNQEYLGGRYTVRINTVNGRVNITSTYTVNGGWSSKDPHPHVSGDSGVPCFGNITGTLAELVAEYEYYAIMLLITNYLSSVNTNDSVGKYAYRWGMVEEDGSVTYPDESIFTCPCCEDEYNEDDIETWLVRDGIVFDENGNVVEEGEDIQICDNCFESYAYYNENEGIYTLEE